VRRSLLGTVKHLLTLERHSDTGSDVARWSEDSNFHSNWDDRTKDLAALVSDRQTVIEYGSGPLGAQRFLPETCGYVGSDLVLRGTGSLAIDLNAKKIPFLPAADVALFSGVLEYVHDLPRLVERLASSVDEVVCSYAPTELNPGDREPHGWVNEYSTDALVDLFARVGFSVDHQAEWKRQVLFKFVRSKPTL